MAKKIERKSTKLELIQRYWLTNRGVGHTTAQLTGLSNTKVPTIYVTTDKSIRRGLLSIGQNNVEVWLPSMLHEGRLAGHHKALVIDHHAMQLIIAEHNDALRKWYEAAWMREGKKI